MQSAVFLEPLKLQQYVSAFDAEGVEDPDDLMEHTTNDLIVYFKMKKHHARKLRRWLDGRDSPRETPREECAGEREHERAERERERRHRALTPALAARRGEMSWDFFLSHYIAETGDIAGLVATKLDHHGFRPWYNKWNRKGTAAAGRIEVTNEGMECGVQRSSVFVLFLSNKVFTRPFCRLEILTALKAKRPFVTLIETERHHGHAFDFGEAAKEGVPQSFHAIIDQIALQIVAIPLRRDIEKQELMLNKLTREYLLSLNKILQLDAETIAVAERGEVADESGPWASLAKAKKRASTSGAAIVAHLQSPRERARHHECSGSEPTFVGGGGPGGASETQRRAAIECPAHPRRQLKRRWNGSDWPSSVILAGHDSHWCGLMGTCVASNCHRVDLPPGNPPPSSSPPAVSVPTSFRTRSARASFGQPVRPPANSFDCTSWTQYLHCLQP